MRVSSFEFRVSGWVVGAINGTSNGKLGGRRSPPCDRHVAPGSDGSGSAADPQGSLESALAVAAPGDEICVAEGILEETVSVSRPGVVVRGGWRTILRMGMEMGCPTWSSGARSFSW